MLALIFQRSYFGFCRKIVEYAAKINQQFRSNVQRGAKYTSNPLLPGGGLEKLQGGNKEEKYFNLNDFKLIVKMREQSMRGAQKCEVCAQAWTALEQEISKGSTEKIKHESCCINKHKNCNEELYFMNQETENLRKLERQMRANLDSNKVRDIGSSKANISDINLKKIPPLE